MGNCFGLISSYYLITDLLEINRCIGLFSSQELNIDNCNYLKELIIKNGCVTIKFAQWYISNLRRRNNKNIKNFCKYFEDIFDQCPYHKLEHTENMFQENFNYSLYDFIQKDTLKPIASGSIGQVYKARLINSDSWVAIKIKHPELNQDIDKYYNLLKIINFLSRFEYFSKKYYLPFNIDEFIEDIASQVDFNIETKNANIFRNIFKDNHMVCIPKIYNNTKDIIISEFIETTDYNDLSKYNKFKCAINLSCFFQECSIIHNFMHGDLHCKNWQTQKIDENNYKLVIFDCALSFSAENVVATQNLWDVFETQDLSDCDEKFNLLINTINQYLLKNDVLSDKSKETLKKLYIDYINSNLDFSYLANNIIEEIYQNNLVCKKSFCNVFFMIGLLLEFFSEANMVCSKSENVSKRSLVIKKNLFESINFCQVTNSYPLLLKNLNKRLDEIKDKDNTLENLFSDLQRNELKFGSIDDSDSDSDDNDDSDANDASNEIGSSDTNDSSKECDSNDDKDINNLNVNSYCSNADDSKTINKIRHNSI